MIQEPYTPIPNSIVTSTIWLEKPHVFKVWMTMYILSDGSGALSATIPGLASVAFVGTEECRNAVSILADENEIIATDRGWRLSRQKRKKSVYWSRAAYPMVFERDGAVCRYCGANERLTVDHVVPRVLGGTDDVENLVVACKTCNSKKGGRTPAQAGMRLN